MTDQYTSLPFLNKYEYAEAIGQRALEIANGSPVTVKCDTNLPANEIAILEFKNGKSPIKIVREFPDGHREIWNINEMKYLLA